MGLRYPTLQFQYNLPFLQPQSAQTLTLSGLIVNTDSLGLIVAIIILDTHEMRVCLLIEAGTSCQDMLIGLVHGFHHLQSKKKANFLVLPRMGIFWCVWHSTTPQLLTDKREYYYLIKVTKELPNNENEVKNQSLLVKNSHTCWILSIVYMWFILQPKHMTFCIHFLSFYCCTKLR